MMPTSRRDALRFIGTLTLFSGVLARAAAQTPRSLVVPEPRYPRELLLGDYRMAEPYGGPTLTLLANGRFGLVFRGCTGVLGRRSGSWRWQVDTLTFAPGPPSVWGMEVAPPPRLIPVRWGVRMYLVDEDRLPAFCEAVRTRATTEDWDFFHLYTYFRGPYRDVPFDGEPDIPERFREWYTYGAVTAKVVTVGADGTVTLDRGSDARLRVGMRLVAAHALGVEVVLTSVEPGRATGTPATADFARTRLLPGDTVTTGNARVYPVTPSPAKPSGR